MSPDNSGEYRNIIIDFEAMNTRRNQLLAAVGIEVVSCGVIVTAISMHESILAVLGGIGVVAGVAQAISALREQQSSRH